MLFSKTTGGFYDPKISSNIPADATDESKWTLSYSALMAAQCSGATIVGDANGFPIAVSQTPTLADVQKLANASIDAQAGATRLKYITDVAGQSETYLSKASDAAAYKAAGYPSASIANYPMVQAEGKALNGATPTAAQYQAAADGILAQQAQWIALAASIEQQRRAGKIAVANATTVAGVQAAQQAAITALAAL